MQPSRELRLLRALALLLCLLWATAAFAQTRVPELRPAPDSSALAGRVLTHVEVAVEGTRWRGAPPIVRAVAGQVLSSELVRRSLDELLETGRFADARAEVEAEGEGVRLIFRVTPRRIIADVRVSGGVLPDDALLRAIGIQVGRELAVDDVERIRARVLGEYARHGFPSAAASVTAIDTDDPLRVALRIDLEPGRAKRIDARRFAVWPDPSEPVLRSLLPKYGAGRGDRSDEEQLEQADRKFEQLLQARGFHRAKVQHELTTEKAQKLTLTVTVHADQRFRISFEGNRLFDGDELLAVLELEESDDRSPETLAEKLRQHYLARGRLDVQVSPSLRQEPGASVTDLVFAIREGEPLRVTARRYPCLTLHEPADVDAEIDSFLAELPGGELLGPVDSRVMDAAYGPTHGAGKRHAPRDFNPYSYYVPDVYDKAIEHLRDLYRSEGYLSASVGPLSLVRRSCDRRSPVGQCIAEGKPAPALDSCRYDDVGLPRELPPPDSALGCVPDPKRGRHCSTDATLSLPIRLGPRTYLHDVAFEGNRALVESKLFSASQLELRVPLSQAELDRARRRILDVYAEEGFAFADVEVELDLSPDHTRGRARFVISEREQVRVSRIVIKGAAVTSERLVRSRVALTTGGVYRRSLVRRTEERLATLGVFGSISVGFEDPYVPAREKVVIITVEERLAQYVDVRPGLSSGEGFRISFEYGHRNLGGEAIALTLRSQLNFLPQQFIIEDDVRAKHESVDSRFGRHNSASVEFPDIGLGPLFRLNVEAIDVRDNARDYSLVKDAFIPRVIFRPERRLSAQLGGSLELNTATILGDTGGLEKYIRDSGQLTTFRVPEGTTFVIAQRVSATWDQRDVPLDATRGFLISGSIEHVRAKPVGETATEAARSSGSGPFDPVVSDFMQYSSRIAGYIPLSKKKGAALALSFRWGLNSQLIERSHTYPDRLFFMGGVDTIRGFTQDSLIPEDLAQQLLDARALSDSDPGDNQLLTVDRILIRGGDIFVNPRAELRIPLTSSIQTALFLDTGNLWSSLRAFEELGFRLRYSVGSGIRIATPVGPLVFDYGFNVDRVLDEIDPSRRRQRFWESLGAFHFSIGLF
ncbi:MAG: outer membrane protein assembly factor [Myxococcales bacterium]|nr:MAG: outer membrane protein assembly factor [Myxococcales bacterium]